MAMSPRLEVRQSQSLTLTPQLMQSIRLLQLSHLELNSFVETELLRNPLLEREDGVDPDAPEPPERMAELDASEDTVDFSDRAQSADAIANGYDTDVENVFPEQGAQDREEQTSPWKERGAPGEESPDIDQYVAAQRSAAQRGAAPHRGIG